MPPALGCPPGSPNLLIPPEGRFYTGEDGQQKFIANVADAHAVYSVYIDNQATYDALAAQFPEGVLGGGGQFGAGITGYSPQSFAEGVLGISGWVYASQGTPFVDYPFILVGGPAIFPLQLSMAVATGIYIDSHCQNRHQYTWTGFILFIDQPEQPPPPPPPEEDVCLSPETILCYDNMGNGDIYTPIVAAGDDSLHLPGVDGYSGTTGWIELGTGTGVASATIDIDPDIELGSGAPSVGIGLGFQIAVNPISLSTSFTKIWTLTGNILLELYAKTVGGVTTYEWRRSGVAKLAAVSKPLQENGAWDVVGALFEIFHLVCNVASGDCDTAPFGVQHSTILRITDLQSGSRVEEALSGTGNSIDGMTFSNGGGRVGFACALLGIRRTGVVVASVAVPASCLSFLGNVCTVDLEDVCMTFDPMACLTCYPGDSVGIPRLIRPCLPADSNCGAVHIDVDALPVIVDPIRGEPVTLSEADGPAVTPTCFAYDPDGFPVNLIVGTPPDIQPINQGCFPIRPCEPEDPFCGEVAIPTCVAYDPAGFPVNLSDAGTVVEPLAVSDGCLPIRPCEVTDPLCADIKVDIAPGSEGFPISVDADGEVLNVREGGIPFVIAPGGTPVDIPPDAGCAVSGSNPAPVTPPGGCKLP